MSVYRSAWNPSKNFWCVQIFNKHSEPAHAILLSFRSGASPSPQYRHGIGLYQGQWWWTHEVGRIHQSMLVVPVQYNLSSKRIRFGKSKWPILLSRANHQLIPSRKLHQVIRACQSCIRSLSLYILQKYRGQEYLAKKLHLGSLDDEDLKSGLIVDYFYDVLQYSTNRGFPWKEVAHSIYFALEIIQQCQGQFLYISNICIWSLFQDFGW